MAADVWFGLTVGAVEVGDLQGCVQLQLCNLQGVQLN